MLSLILLSGDFKWSPPPWTLNLISLLLSNQLCIFFRENWDLQTKCHFSAPVHLHLYQYPSLHFFLSQGRRFLPRNTKHSTVLRIPPHPQHLHFSHSSHPPMPLFCFFCLQLSIGSSLWADKHTASPPKWQVGMWEFNQPQTENTLKINIFKIKFQKENIDFASLPTIYIAFTLY